MSADTAGNFWCDRCGEEVGNGSIFRCAVISDLDIDDPNTVRNLHICRDVVDDDGNVTRKGCIGRVLSAANLAHYHEVRSERERKQQQEEEAAAKSAKKSAAGRKSKSAKRASDG
jgi:hypothetical protein